MPKTLIGIRLGGVMQLENKSEPSAEPGKEFVFRLRNGTEVGRARTLSEFLAKLKTVPVESVDYHFSGHHFSPWLRYIRLNDLAGSIERLNSRGERLRQEIIDLVNSQTVSRFVGR